MKTTKIKSSTDRSLEHTKDSTVLNIENNYALDIFGINNENLDFIEQKLPLKLFQKGNQLHIKGEKKFRNLLRNTIFQTLEEIKNKKIKLEYNLMQENIKMSLINESENIKKPVLFFDTFLFQFINPKGVMVAMIAVSTFIDVQNNYLRDATIVITTYFFMAVFSVSSWCLLGKYLRKFATSKNFIKKFNYIMSFLLIVCVIMFYV